jgi:large conductance mechanosensitive channel
MLKGFKEFIMRGNLVELAVAFIMASAFAAVVTALVEVIMDAIGRFAHQPDFSQVAVGGVVVGGFLNAVISFLVLAAVVYFFIVVPYNELRERRAQGREPEPEAPAEDVALLREIRDLLAARDSGGTD